MTKPTSCEHVMKVDGDNGGVICCKCKMKPTIEEKYIPCHPKLHDLQNVYGICTQCGYMTINDVCTKCEIQPSPEARVDWEKVKSKINKLQEELFDALNIEETDNLQEDLIAVINVALDDCEELRNEVISIQAAYEAGVKKGQNGISKLE